MKRTALVFLIIVMAAAIAVTAQGKWGRGRCGAGQNGSAAQSGCNFGICGFPGMAGVHVGGWWNNVQPQTPQQKQFVREIADLHSRIRNERTELDAIKANNSNPKRAAALETDLAALRTKVYDLMTSNQPLLKQMGIPAPDKAMCEKAAICPSKGACASQGAVCPKSGAGGCPVSGAAKCQPGSSCPLTNK